MRVNWKAAGLALLTVGCLLGLAVGLAAGEKWAELPLGLAAVAAVLYLAYWVWRDVLEGDSEEEEAKDAG